MNEAGLKTRGTSYKMSENNIPKSCDEQVDFPLINK